MSKSYQKPIKVNGKRYTRYDYDIDGSWKGRDPGFTGILWVGSRSGPITLYTTQKYPTIAAALDDVRAWIETH